MIQIRPERAEDMEFLWEMLFYAAHADEDPEISPHHIRRDPDLQRYLDGWGRPGDRAVVAVDEDRPVGAAWLRRFRPDEIKLVTFVDFDTPELAIAVTPDRIGQGIGTQLMARLLANADQDNVPSVVLGVRANNPAVRLYERHGFVEIDRVTNRVGTESLKMLRMCTAVNRKP